MREPDHLAFAGDWHQNTHWATNTIRLLAERLGVDTIVHTGDYGFTFAAGFVRGVEQVCADHGVNLYFIDGNHDNHDLLWRLPLDESGFGQLSPHVRYIPRAHRWQWWGKTFMGLGGAVSVDKKWRRPGIEWWPTERITYRDMRDAIEPGPVDVLVTHDCPDGVEIPGISYDEGIKYFPAEALIEADEHRHALGSVVSAVSPKLLVHGHYHVRHAGWRGDTRIIGLDMDATSINKNIMFAYEVSDLEAKWEK